MFAGHFESEFRNAWFNQSRLIDQVQFVYQVTAATEMDGQGNGGKMSRGLRTLTLRLPSRATVIGAGASGGQTIAVRH